LGALLSIQRNLRLMYVHAYQSLVWNRAAGERWKLFQDAVVEGDLVLVNEHKEQDVESGVAGPDQGVDADGEIIVQPSGEDRSSDRADAFERARALTANEAASGRYSILDVVLPLPGFDVLYPANASGDWYRTFMASGPGGGLDPQDMRRKHKDFSLSGGYRKILARIGPDFDVQVHEYADGGGDKQFVETDMERLNRAKQQKRQQPNSRQTPNMDQPFDEKPVPAATVAVEDEGVRDEGGVGGGNGGGDASSVTRLAAVLKFQLGSSQYATMALRELSRGGIQAYKADYTGGR
jgi:tRNA pseudouridine13 synthase